MRRPPPSSPLFPSPPLPHPHTAATLQPESTAPSLTVTQPTCCSKTEPGSLAPRRCRSSPRMPRSSSPPRSEEHTSELQSQSNLVCRLLLEKKKKHHT